MFVCKRVCVYESATLGLHRAYRGFKLHCMLTDHVDGQGQRYKANAAVDERVDMGGLCLLGIVEENGFVGAEVQWIKGPFIALSLFQRDGAWCAKERRHE